MSEATDRRLPASARVQRALVRLLGAIPPRALAALPGVRQTNADGDRLAPEIGALLAINNRIPGADFSEHDVAQARAVVEREALTVAEQFPPFAIEEDLELPGGLPATRYRSGTTSRGLVLYFHGGGFVVGNRASTQSAVRFIAHHAGVDVLSIDYRLAPEHPFPAAVDDTMTAWRYAVATAPSWGIDPHRIVVAGDSAGGNLAASLALQLRGAEVQPALQALIFPVTDMTSKHPSYREFSSGSSLTEQQMDWYLGHYLSTPDDARDPRASPLLASDLSGVAPAHVTVAGFDPLRDEGIAYAQRLAAAGVPTTLHRAGSLVHAFIWFTGFSRDSREQTLVIARAIADAVA